jgi:hypothetical protein
MSQHVSSQWPSSPNEFGGHSLEWLWAMLNVATFAQLHFLTQINALRSMRCDGLQEVALRLRLLFLKVQTSSS